MNMNHNQQIEEQSNSLLCISCKVFFGSEDFNKMCSQCHKKNAQKAEENIEKKVEESTKNTADPKTPESKTKISCEEKVEEKNSESQIKVNLDRCFNCNRKLKLLGVQCRCGMFFCNSHRMPQQHKCTFDYRNLGKAKLTQQNLKVAPAKIDSI